MNGEVVRLSYNALDQLETLTTPAGAVLHFVCDLNGHITEIQLPNDRRVQYTYQFASNAVSSTNSAIQSMSRRDQDRLIESLMDCAGIPRESTADHYPAVLLGLTSYVFNDPDSMFDPNVGISKTTAYGKMTRFEAGRILASGDQKKIEELKSYIKNNYGIEELDGFTPYSYYGDDTDNSRLKKPFYYKEFDNLRERSNYYHTSGFNSYYIIVDNRSDRFGIPEQEWNKMVNKAWSKATKNLSYYPYSSLRITIKKHDFTDWLAEQNALKEMNRISISYNEMIALWSGILDRSSNH